MGSPLPLKVAIGTYDHTRPLKDGSVTSDRVALEHVEISPINRAFRPAVNDLAFDVAELAIVTYLLARAAGRPLVGLPVVLLRVSPFASIVCHARSGIREPRDLEGRRLGVRSYTQTTGVWLRGILEAEYGTRLDRIQWVTGEGAHLDGFQDPPNVSRADGVGLAAMLLAGELDATVGVALPEHPDLRPLFPDAARAEASWTCRTGLFPVNHIVVVKAELLRAHLWLRQELLDLFDAARRVASERSGRPIPPFGVEANRASIEAVSRYAHAQGIVARAYTADELFSV